MIICISVNTHVFIAKEEVGGGGGAEARERLAGGRVREQAARAAEHAEGERAHLRAAAAAAAVAAAQRAPRLAHALQRYNLITSLVLYLLFIDKHTFCL